MYSILLGVTTNISRKTLIYISTLRIINISLILKNNLNKRVAKECYDEDSRKKFYLKDIPNAEEIKKAIENLGFLPDSDKEQLKAFEEKYEYFPRIYVDDKPFIKAKTKFINDNVQFRKGIVKISVEYLDE